MSVGKKISELTTATPLTGLELAVVVQSGETRQTTVKSFAASVSAELSLKVNRANDYMTGVQYIGFDTAVSNGLATGRLAWNSNDGTLDVGLLGGSILQVGQETLYYVKNTSGAPISDGQVVMATGTVGASGKIAVGLADGSGATSAEYFLGVATQDIADNDFGYVTHFGLVRGFNTSGSPYGETWADGDLLYVSRTVPGGLTKVPPTYPGFSTPIAIVINAASGGSGSIFVRMKSGEYLSQLHDVNITSPVSGDIIFYDSATSAWVNSPRLVNAEASISALNLQVGVVSAAITSTNAVVSALEVRVSAVSALAASFDPAVFTSINNVVSALEIRVSAVSAVASATRVQVNAVSVLVSALVVRVAAVSASVSALQVQVNAVSALVSVNTAAITSINAVVTFSAKAFTSATFNDGYTEEVVTISGLTPALSPGNGSVQLWTLTNNSTPGLGTWNAGQALTLMIDDGTAYTITWTSVAPVWKTNGGVAPTLNTTGYTVIQFWKVESTIYGARVGDA